MEAVRAFMPPLSEGLVYVDEHLVVLDKPAGLLAVPGRGADKQDCLATRAQALWPDALVVHRLDMATSGLVVMARGLAMQRALSRAFEQREVEKRYEAIAAGHLGAPGATGTIALPLGADWPNRPLQKVDPVHGKPSVTHWRVLAWDAQRDATRLALEPVTGRSHQLRVHLQAIGHPLVGDTLYAPPAVQVQAPRLLLHAALLQFAHPASGETVRFESAVPF
jgi:tRNA pseudouridine32 synthase/23S rRNA pseudouridine746 synthase